MTAFFANISSTSDDRSAGANGFFRIWVTPCEEKIIGTNSGFRRCMNPDTPITVFAIIGSALVLIAFVLFRPDFFMNRIQPPFEAVQPAQFVQAVGNAAVGEEIRVTVSGPDFDTGEVVETTIVVIPGSEADGEARLAAVGLTVLEEDGLTKLDEPFPGTPYFEQLGNFDFYADEPVAIKSANLKVEQLPKELIYIPGLILLVLVYLLQRSRVGRKEGMVAA